MKNKIMLNARKELEGATIIIKIYYSSVKLNLDEKLNIADFAKWCNSNNIVLLKTQTQKYKYLEKNPDSVVLTLIELMSYIKQKSLLVK